MDLPSDFVERVECRTHENLEFFLTRFSPLTAHCCWVYIHGSNQADIDRMDEAAFQAGLSFLKSRGDAVTLAEVNDVAHRSRCTSGKWKIRVQAQQLERTWGRIARAVHSGALACSSAKVSTTTVQQVRDRGSNHTIYVYVDNYLEEEKVGSLRNALQKLILDDGQKDADYANLAQFKPDIYTYMGWRSGCLPPAIPVYHSLEPVCAACGNRRSKSNTLKKCTACQLVRYCNVECQRAHRKVHRKMCKVEKENK